MADNVLPNHITGTVTVTKEDYRMRAHQQPSLRGTKSDKRTPSCFKRWDLQMLSPAFCLAQDYTLQAEGGMFCIRRLCIS